MEPPADSPSLRARFVACRLCFGLALLACLAVVVAGATMPWLVPPDVPATMARLREAPGGPSREILAAVERNPWRAQEGHGPLPLGEFALWLAVAGTVLGLVGSVRARGLPPRRPLCVVARGLWLAGALATGMSVWLYRDAHLEAVAPRDAQTVTVAYRVERKAEPRRDARFRESIRLGPMGWGPGLFVPLAGLLGGGGLLSLAARPAGR